MKKFRRCFAWVAVVVVTIRKRRKVSKFSFCFLGFFFVCFLYFYFILRIN